MQKKFLIATLIIVSLFVIFFIFNRDESKIIEITVNDNNLCNWEYEINDNNVVEYVKKFSFTDDDTDEKFINFVFKGNMEGKTKVTLKCINKENELIDEKIYTMKVDKWKNISLNLLD